MKNRSTIWAALALGTVLGAGAASLVPHAAAAPTATPLQEGVNARLDALESQVKQLKTDYAELKASGVKTTVYEVAPSTAVPNQGPDYPPSGYANIPPYKLIPLNTTGK